MKRFRLYLFCFLLAACSAAALYAADPVKILRADLTKVLSDARLADAQLGVEVYSLDRAEILYGKNPQKLFVPASNNKLLTAAAALLCLGSDYRFKTEIWAQGPVVNGVLKGDLIIAGFGDPSSSSWVGSKDPFEPFQGWAAKLKQHGISALEGAILGDGGAFEGTEHGQGWAWDDLTEGYAAPVSALQFNENQITLEISPGPETGAPASVRTAPLPDYGRIESHVQTGSVSSAPRISIERSKDTETFVVRGVIPLRGAPLTRTVSVQFPIDYYLTALKSSLSREGISVAGCEIKRVRRYRPITASLLWTHTSAPLSELVSPMMKMSLNLSAESLTRVLGLEIYGEGIFSRGKDAVEQALLRMGLSKESYAYADGSGLSRLNLVSADALIHILKFMHQSSHFPVFYGSLAIAGVDGTLETRMRRAGIANNVRAKTGSVANVSALSGYVQTADKEMLAFAILTNNFLVSRSVVESMQEKALARLAAFTRKNAGHKVPGFED